MMSFLTDHPLLSMTVYILMLTAGFTFLVELEYWRRWKRKKDRDEHSEYPGHESYRGERE